MQATWRKQQQHVLSALKIPVFELRNQVTLAMPCDAAKKVVADAPAEQYCYRVGPLYIFVSAPLPVEPPRWMTDLCLLWDCAPVAVKAPADDAMTVRIDRYLQHGLTDSDKRELWQHLQAVY